MAFRWDMWAPPLDPPTEGGLPLEVAQRIASADFDCPYMAAALMWDAYAASLTPEPAIASVSTGVQQVTYTSPGGRWAMARDRADWLRGLCGTLTSARVAVREPAPELPPDWWQRNMAVPR